VDVPTDDPVDVPTDDPPMINGYLALPTGAGLAAAFPFDKGLAEAFPKNPDGFTDINGKPQVVLQEDFSDYPNDDIFDHMVGSTWEYRYGDRWAVSQSGFVSFDRDSKASEPYSLRFQNNGHAGSEFGTGINRWLVNVDDYFGDTMTDQEKKYYTGGYDVLYIRYYVKYGENFQLIGSSHNGGGVSGGYSQRPGGQAHAGHQSNGYNKFLVAYEHWSSNMTDRQPGWLNFYIYFPGQGDIWGNHFYPNGSMGPISDERFRPTHNLVAPNFAPERGRWYCYEFMVKLNTVIDNGEFEHFVMDTRNPTEVREAFAQFADRYAGMSQTAAADRFMRDYNDRRLITVHREPEFLHDGRLAGWVDGELIMDYTDLVYRFIDQFGLDKVSFGFHTRDNSVVTSVSYDNIVVATAYIGPMVDEEGNLLIGDRINP
jgi:hypothetical protein